MSKGMFDARYTVCPGCESVFMVGRNVYRNSLGVLCCSVECADRKEKTMAMCSECGTKFDPEKPPFYKNDEGTLCCSLACQAKSDCDRRERLENDRIPKTEMKLIEVPVIEGYDVVAFRAPIVGDVCISPTGMVQNVNIADCVQPRLILRKKWKWPDWLPRGLWVTVDSTSVRKCHVYKPFLQDDGTWRDIDGTTFIATKYYRAESFITPQYSDWREACWLVED